jgi:DNA-binding NtrC family response regulator
VVLVMTAVGQVEDAVRAMKLGALDFLNKPVDHEALVRLVEKSQDYQSDKLAAEAFRKTRQRELSMDIIAESPELLRTLEIAADVAQSDVNSVVIQGESGTGKNVVSRYIHAMSPRKEKPFLEVNCAAIPDQLIESELFGHERGAFTDAKANKKGTFELANEGTVVLDEIAELKPELQSKLLSFLENRFFRRVGGVREIHVDIRVIALTNRDLKTMVATVPALRERIDDILPLARHFLQSLKGKYGRPFSGFERDTENQLLGYSWPGNVRELRNAVERAMILERESKIGPSSLILEGIGVVPDPSAERTRGIPEGIVPLEEVELEMVTRAMAAAANNQTRAAELLGVSRDQLRYRLKKFDL